MWSEIIVQFNPNGQTHRPGQRIMRTDVAGCAYLAQAVLDGRIVVSYINARGERIKMLSWREADVFEIACEGSLA